MRVKKVIAGILLTVMLSESSLTSLAAPVTDIGVVTETVTETEEATQGTETSSEIVGEEGSSTVMSEVEESSVIESVSEEESVSSDTEVTDETVSQEEDVAEETTAVGEDAVLTPEETTVETVEETQNGIATESVSDNMASEDTEVKELDYILGRPMTEEEIEAQLSLIPDYMPQLEVMPMDSATDIHAGSNMINMLAETSLPSSYDARDYGKITSVKDQNPWGTCWSFATMALLESSWLQQYGETLDLSERHMAYFVKNTGYDPLGNASGDTITPYNDSYYLESGGNLFRSALKLMNWHGAADEADYPYSYTVPAAIARENAQDRIAGVENVFFVPTENATQEEKVTVVKQLIKTYGCVEWSYYHSKYSYYNASTGAYYINTDAYGTNHSITIVGWDDSYSKENFSSDATPENDGAWIVKNSWGTGFGKNGYMYLSYEDMSLGAGNPVSVIIAGDAEDHDNNYFYGNTGTVWSAGTFLKIGHVYQINGDTAKQNITSVSVMVAEDSMPYSVQLYKNPDMTDGVVTDPESGMALLSEPVTGTTGYAGLYTIDIPEVTVAVDDYVSVVFTLEDRGNFYLTTSMDTESTDGTVLVSEVDEMEPGQCFYGYSHGWYDAEEDGYTFMLNLLTENVDETIIVPTLTYTLGAPTDFTDTIDCNLKWAKCSNALGYELYRAEGVDGSFEKIADIDSSARTYLDQISLSDKEKTYYYKLAAVYENDVVEESEPIAVDLSDVQLLPETDFKQYMNFVLLTWEEMTGAAGYILEKKTEDESTYTQLADIKSGQTLSYKDKDVSLYDNVYEYRVRAYTSTGVYSDWSEWATTDIISVTQDSGNTIRVKWRAVNDTSYYKLRMGNYYWLKKNAYSLWINNLNEVGDEAKYYVEMYASETAYNNGESPIYTTPAIYYYAVPDSLTGLSAAWDGEAASFTWDATTTADAIVIYRSRTADDMGETAYAEVEGTATSYTDTAIDGIGMYYYWFVPQATNSLGEIDCAEAVAAQIEVTVEPVNLISVTEKTESSVEITWEKHNLADGYCVYRKGSDDSGYEKIATISDVEQLSYVDENVIIGKTYEYKVVIICEDGESGLDSAEYMQICTTPAVPVLMKAYMTSVELKNNPDLEYGAVEHGMAPEAADYISGTEETLLITGLSENTSYEVYARTKTTVTGENSVYSTALGVTTEAVDAVSIELEKNSLTKGETTGIRTIIFAGEESETYTGEVLWSAVDTDGQECGVLTQGTSVSITGTDGNEILCITGEELTATALSETKEITLKGTIFTSSGTELADQAEVVISVPLETLDIRVEAVNNTESDSLEGIDIGDTAVVYAHKEPFNADETTLQWKSQDETVVVITADTEDDSRAHLEIKGLGNTTIKVQSTDGAIADELEVDVILDPVVMISAAEISANRIDIKWEQHPSAEGYKLYRKDGSKGNYVLLTEMNDADQSSYEDTSVITGKTYYYKVTAVCDGTESDLSVTEEVFARTSPAAVTIAENGITYESVTINFVEGLEYTITLSGTDRTTLDYIKSTSDTLTFNGLEPNTNYVIYVRTDSEVTGETAVYGPALSVSTLVKAELVLSIKDTVLSKGNKLPFSYTITPDNLHYKDSLAWSAADIEGQACEVITMGADTVVVNGSDGEEICRISNGYFYASGESAQKDVYITVKRGSLEADFHVKIHIPVTDIQMQVVSVDGDPAVTSLEAFSLGQKAQLALSLAPINAEETILWSSSNEKVVSVNVAETEDTRAEISANGTGSCVITAISSDGVKTNMTVMVNKVASLYGIWISDMADLSGTVVEKDPLTGEYISENLEKQPVYELDDMTVSGMTIVSYVLEDENGGAIRKAEAEDGIVYRSSDPLVAAVTPEGNVTAVGTGETEIIAYESKGNGIYGSCRVIVTKQDAEVPEPEGYPLDKAIKLSAVTPKLNIESFVLDEKSSCQVQIKDQHGKIYSSEEEMELFAFSSANPSVCMVDEKGVVRPNPTYAGKTTSVKITAALKGDIAGRKVVCTVKLLTEKQIDRITLECISVSENTVVTQTGVVEQFEKGKKLSFTAKAYDSKGNVIENPKLKFTLSDTKVAKLKDNKDGTVSVTATKAGRTNLIVTGNDVWKKTEIIQITTVDTKPYLSKTSVTLNRKLESQELDGEFWKVSEDISVQMPENVVLSSLGIAGASIGKNTLSNEELTNLSWVKNEDASYYIALKEAYAEKLPKNTKISVLMRAEVENTLFAQNVTEMFAVTVKITLKEPKISVAEAKSINRFYTDKDETLLILKTPSIVTEAEVLNSEYFTVTELKRGQWYLKFSDPNGTYDAKKTKITLRLTAQGYEPVEKELTVQTPYKAPALKQQTVPVLHLANERLQQAEIVLYDKTNKVELSGYEIAAFTAAKLDEGVVSGSGFFVSLKEGATFKNNEKVTAQISIQKPEWTAPVPMKVSVKVSTKAPKLVLSSAKVTLNTQAAAEHATVKLTVDQKNVEFTPDTEWKLQMYDADSKSWLPVAEEYRNDWLAVSYDAFTQKMEIGWQDGKTVLPGNCKFRIGNVIEGFENVYGVFTVKVVDEKPTLSVTVKGKQDLINRKSGSLVGTIKYKNAVASKAVDIRLLSADGTKTNETFAAQLLADGRFTIRLTEAGMKDTSLKKQKYTYPIAVTMENGTVVEGKVSFSLTQAAPKVKVPALQTIYKSMAGLAKEYDFASGLADGVSLAGMDMVSVPKGFTAVYKDGSVVVTLNDRGIKAGSYQIKVKLYFEGAAEGSKPVSKTVKVKVAE